MYKTTDATVLPGQNSSNVVRVPGRLIGVAYSGQGTLTTMYLTVRTPLGLFVMYNDIGETVGAKGGVANGAYVAVSNAPMGNAEYLVQLYPAPTIASVVVLFSEELD